MLVAPRVMETVVWAEEDGYDATVIGCFYDPFVRGAKELSTRMVVTAPAEACLRIAQSLGERISIVVGRRKWIPEMEENVYRYGAERNLASFRVLEMGVSEFQTDPAVTEKLIRQQAEAAVEHDRADVVVLGCTIEFGFFRSLQDELGVPVVDATVAPLLYAELLADASKNQGWRTSPALGYGTPAADEVGTFLTGRAPQLTLDPRRVG
jgi:allantoin racemase